MFLSVVSSVMMKKTEATSAANVMMVCLKTWEAFGHSTSLNSSTRAGSNDRDEKGSASSFSESDNSRAFLPPELNDLRYFGRSSEGSLSFLLK